MGTCWEGRKLCCDICGHAGARRVRCPFGYCPSVAACAECRKAHGARGTGKLARAGHVAAGCDRRHAEYVAHEAERAALVSAGRFLRVSAVNEKIDGFPLVKVWFRHWAFLGDGCKLGLVDQPFAMTPATYAAIPLGANATIEDYLTHGFVVPLEN